MLLMGASSSGKCVSLTANHWSTRQEVARVYFQDPQCVKDAQSVISGFHQKKLDGQGQAGVLALTAGQLVPCSGRIGVDAHAYCSLSKPALTLQHTQAPKVSGPS